MSSSSPSASPAPPPRPPLMGQAPAEAADVDVRPFLTWLGTFECARRCLPLPAADADAAADAGADADAGAAAHFSALSEADASVAFARLADGAALASVVAFISPEHADALCLPPPPTAAAAAAALAPPTTTAEEALERIEALTLVLEVYFEADIEGRFYDSAAVAAASDDAAAAAAADADAADMDAADGGASALRRAGLLALCQLVLAHAVHGAHDAQVLTTY